MKKIFLTKTAQPPCHAEFISASDPSAQGARCRNKSGMTWDRGFTLAEILITLGVLGIVAAITIPALITNYQNRVYETSKMVFENRLGEALRQMNIAEDLTGLGTTEAFVDKLQKYMKIIKRCEEPNAHACFADKFGTPGDFIQSNIVKKADNFVGNSLNWDTNAVGIVLQNGASALLAYNPGCQSPGITATVEDLRPCIAITYDTNGKKLPNEYGKDLGGEMAGKPFWIELPSGLKISAAVVFSGTINTCSTDSKYYTPNNSHCASDQWAAAKQACEKIGARLPKSGAAVNNVKTDSACASVSSPKHNLLSSTSEVCQIRAYGLKTGTGYHFWVNELTTVNCDWDGDRKWGAGSCAFRFAFSPTGTNVEKAGSVTDLGRNGGVADGTPAPLNRGTMCVR